MLWLSERRWKVVLLVLPLQAWCMLESRDFDPQILKFQSQPTIVNLRDL